MNYQPIQCPINGRECPRVNCAQLGHCFLRPPKHKGTAVVSSHDPPTAGSETPAGPSRRSLPDAVEEAISLARQIDEAADAQEVCQGYDFPYIGWQIQLHQRRLVKRLSEINGRLKEQPEGNIEVSQREADV